MTFLFSSKNLQLIFYFLCEQSIHESRNDGGYGKHANIPISVREGFFIKRPTIDNNTKFGKNVKLLLREE